MTVYAPKGRNTRAAVLVFPGGSDQVLAMVREGTDICCVRPARGHTAGRTWAAAGGNLVSDGCPAGRTWRALSATVRKPADRAAICTLSAYRAAKAGSGYQNVASSHPADVDVALGTAVYAWDMPHLASTAHAWRSAQSLGKPLLIECAGQDRQLLLQPRRPTHGRVADAVCAGFDAPGQTLGHAVVVHPQVVPAAGCRRLPVPLFSGAGCNAEAFVRLCGGVRARLQLHLQGRAASIAQR